MKLSWSSVCLTLGLALVCYLASYRLFLFGPFIEFSSFAKRPAYTNQRVLFHQVRPYWWFEDSGLGKFFAPAHWVDRHIRPKVWNK